MNTHQTWSDSPIHEAIRDAGLDPVNRTTNDTPTPSPFATDGQRTTDAECWMNYCLEAEKGLTTVTEQRDRMEEKLRIELRGHPDSELWGDAGLIAATMRCVDALDEVTEQRDEAREALKTGGMLNIIDRTHHERAAAIRERDEARHSLTTVTEQRDRLAEAIRLTLINNLDLCDGDICTLKRLKDAFGFDLDSLENVPVRPPARKESL